MDVDDGRGRWTWTRDVDDVRTWIRPYIKKNTTNLFLIAWLHSYEYTAYLIPFALILEKICDANGEWFTL